MHPVRRPRSWVDDGLSVAGPVQAAHPAENRHRRREKICAAHRTRIAGPPSHHGHSAAVQHRG